MLKGMAAGNLLLASAILLSGATYTKIASLSEICNWRVFSGAMYTKIAPLSEIFNWKIFSEKTF